MEGPLRGAGVDVDALFTDPAAAATATATDDPAVDAGQGGAQVMQNTSPSVLLRPVAHSLPSLSLCACGCGGAGRGDGR